MKYSISNLKLSTTVTDVRDLIEKNLFRVYLHEGITKIRDYCFMGITDRDLTVYIPKSITSIGYNIFAESTIGTLNHQIYYSGTKAEWLLIPKASGWHSYQHVTVNCSDGTKEYN